VRFGLFPIRAVCNQCGSCSVSAAEPIVEINLAQVSDAVRKHSSKELFASNNGGISCFQDVNGSNRLFEFKFSGSALFKN
jgi:hypothetical protein